MEGKSKFKKFAVGDRVRITGPIGGTPFMCDGHKGTVKRVQDDPAGSGKQNLFVRLDKPAIGETLEQHNQPAHPILELVMGPGASNTWVFRNDERVKKLKKKTAEAGDITPSSKSFSTPGGSYDA